MSTPAVHVGSPLTMRVTDPVINPSCGMAASNLLAKPVKTQVAPAD